jgi:hypothetical protein
MNQYRKEFEKVGENEIVCQPVLAKSLGHLSSIVREWYLKGGIPS